MEVETRDMLPQAKDHQESSETDKERGFPESLIPWIQIFGPTTVR